MGVVLKDLREMATTAHTYKIILLGEAGVGKTTLFLRLQMGDFVDLECRTNATMGIDYLERSYVFDEEEVRVSACTLLSEYIKANANHVLLFLFNQMPTLYAHILHILYIGLFD